MPPVLPASGANVAFPPGSPVTSAERVPPASPSGSTAVMFSVNGRPSAAAALAAAVTIGARSTFATVIEAAADPACELPAVNVTAYGPGAASKPGVQLNVAAVLEVLGVNVAPGGRLLAESERMVWPSGSAAVTPNVSNWPSVAAAPAGAVTTGGRSTLVTVMPVTLLPASTLVALKVTL